MNISRQVYELNELDAQIKSTENSLNEKRARLGESQSLIAAREKYNLEKRLLDDLKKRQRSLETDMNDLSQKISATEEELYSGRIRNPKELTGLQQELNVLKGKYDGLETEALELMSQIDVAESGAAAARADFNRVEKEWRSQQEKLSVEIEQLESRLRELGEDRQKALVQIAAEVVDLYENLRSKKGHAVSRVEQGICRSCRISLSSSQLQQAKSGNLVQCNSCGRILFFP